MGQEDGGHGEFFPVPAGFLCNHREVLLPRSPFRLSSPCRQFHNLQRKLSDLEGNFRLREKELLGSLEDARGNEKKLADNAHNLGIKLEAARAEVAELNLRLSAAEGRVQGLEVELARVEGLKRDVEFKLSSLHSALRRTMGISRGGRAPSPAIVRGRGTSPKRLFSPTKGMHLRRATYLVGSPIRQ